jgi:hypothetical protein
VAFCVFYRDASNALRTLPIDTSLAVTAAYQAAGSLLFDGSARATILDLSTVKENPTDDLIIVDVLSYDYRIYEIQTRIKADLTTIDKVVDITYERYGDVFARTIASNENYIAIGVSSFEENFRRALVFKRRSKGGSTFTHYSLDLSDIIGTTSPFDIQLLVYRKPGETQNKLMVQDMVSRSLARIYNLTDLTVVTKNIGYYEQLRLRNMNFTVNDGNIFNFTRPVMDIFFNQGLPNPNVQDRKWTNYLWDYLTLWIVLGSILFVVVCILLIYTVRREVLKDHLVK